MVNTAQSAAVLAPDPRSVRTLIIARAAIVLVLAYATAVWTAGGERISGAAFFSTGLAGFLFTAISLSLVYYLLLAYAGRHTLQVLVQMVMDVFLITWLLFETGDATSPYFPLYILTIGVSGAFLNANATLFISAFSGGCYTVLSLIMSQTFLSYSVTDAPSRIVQIVGFNDVALLVVGLLAARLSERRRYKRELEEKTTSFDNLNLLHERILESIDSGLITTDLEGKIFGFNRSAEMIVGAEYGEMVGKSIYDLFGDEIRPSVALAMDPPEADGFKIRHFEAGVARNGDSDGAARTAVVCTPAPLTTKDGERYGMILSFQDVSRVRSMEESLRRSDRLAAVGRLSAGLAHEIRNPLGSMGSALQYLRDKVRPGTKEEALMEVVIKESERLNRIITDFLAYSRPGEGIRERIDVRGAIDDTITLLKLDPHMTPEHSVEFNRPEDPVYVNADDSKIRQVLWNLMRNAVQAMPDGGRLLVTTEELKGIHVRIVIEDNGTGMDAEKLDRVFEPFSGGSGGTGLGLPIAHRIVLEHGGRMDIFSEPGKGTKAIIELPQ